MKLDLYQQVDILFSILEELLGSPFNKQFDDKAKHVLSKYGLEVADGKIVKSQRRVSAEAKENGYGESEDERIKKEIIAILKYKYRLHPKDPKYSNVPQWIAWLEKQDGQKLQGKTALETINEEKMDNANYAKSADKVKPKFHKGDWVVVSTTKGDRVVQIASVEYFKDGHPSYFTTEGRWFGNGTKARLLTDKDVETITLPESKVIVNQKPAEWGEEDERLFNSTIWHLRYSVNNGDFELPAGQLEDWLKSLKDRVQPKQEWSEKDTEVLNGIANYLFTSTDVSNVEGSDEWYDWLKSLKNRIQSK